MDWIEMDNLTLTPLKHTQAHISKQPGGGGVLTLTWFTIMCPPFRVFFSRNLVQRWGRGVIENRELK